MNELIMDYYLDDTEPTELQKIKRERDIKNYELKLEKQKLEDSEGEIF